MSLRAAGYELLAVWEGPASPAGLPSAAPPPAVPAQAGDGPEVPPALDWLVWPGWELTAGGRLRPREAVDGPAGGSAAGPVPAARRLLALPLDGPSAALLAEPVARREALQALAGAGADGVCLDVGAAVDPALRDELSAWAEELSWHLHRAGRILAVAVEPQVRDPDDGPGPAVDYRTLGVYADRLLLRGFGHRGDVRPPHATAPVGWLQSALEYALSVVPARRVVLCLPLFGLRWRDAADRAERIPLAQAAALAAERRLDPATACWRLRGHDAAGGFEAWCDDADTLAAKAGLVRDYDAGGIGLWGLGGEPPGLWTRLA